jgi:hypothetical protein
MKLIENNPYRVLGILASASIRDKTKTISRLKMLIEAEQSVSDDFSFPHLGNVDRTLDAVDKAASSLDLDKDKLRAAIFWFCNGNHTDEPAFDLLKEKDTEGAIQIWAKLTRSGVVSKTNSSAFLNLSTLNLWKAFNNGTIESELLRDGIALKLKFFESDFLDEFVKLSTDVKFRASRIELEEVFLKEVYEEVVKLGNGYEPEFWSSLSGFEYSAKSSFEKSVIQSTVERIENYISESKNDRKKDVSKSIAIGNKLLDNTEDDLNKLKNIVGDQSPKFTTASDKVGNEAAQCAIGYFNHYRDTDNDPGIEAERLIERAKGKLTIDRLKENGDVIHEWNEDRENRLKYKSISPLVDSIGQEITKYKLMRVDSASAETLVKRCKPLLAQIGSEVGFEDKLYIQLSTTIAIAALNNVIAHLNWVAEQLLGPKSSYLPDFHFGPSISLESAREFLYEIHSAMVLIGILDMDSEFEHESYRNNKYDIEKICKNIGASTKSGFGIKKISASNKSKNHRVKIFSGIESTVSNRTPAKQKTTSQSDTKWTIISIWILIILAILFLIYIRMGK